ncbi:anti-sigma factor [Sphingomonas sp. ST-64]|uniref:Anti-sigma factor n=1 Tax=Sphingomonas plantiphila TaxID=3163295 RepID=A0ABW8YPN6_9SPHN
MTIDPETLMAYADGELGPLEAKRVEEAINANPALGVKVDRHRALAASLRGTFAPVAHASIPTGVEAMLRESAKVVPLAPRANGRERKFWIGAVAASLVAGFFTGPLVTSSSELVIEDGRTLARGEIARALDTQLASTQTDNAATRIGITFRDRNQHLCRSFDHGATSGIACTSGEQWQVEWLSGGGSGNKTEYRQAGSSSAELMALAQAMMADEPLNAAEEADAITNRAHRGER